MSYYPSNDEYLAWGGADLGYSVPFDMSEYNVYSTSPMGADFIPLSPFDVYSTSPADPGLLSRSYSSDGSTYSSIAPASPGVFPSRDTLSPAVLQQPGFDNDFLGPYNPTLPVGHHTTSAPRPVPPRSRESRYAISTISPLSLSLRVGPCPANTPLPTRSSTSSQPQGYSCPRCPIKHPFRRRADLNRHIQHMHGDPSSLDSFPCDYPRCSRRQEPFHRRDHYRDHLREFHREDIEKRGVSPDRAWYQGRNTVTSWWRCNHCLERVSVDKHGFECPLCKAMCCAKRQEVRRR
ncbi:hypothetical protein ACO1O0_004964 [Amphichorda felina]